MIDFLFSAAGIPVDALIALVLFWLIRWIWRVVSTDGKFSAGLTVRPIGLPLAFDPYDEATGKGRIVFLCFEVTAAEGGQD